MARLVSCLCLLLLAPLTHAQGGSEAGRAYQVELLILTHVAPDPVDRAPANASAPRLRGGTALRTPPETPLGPGDRYPQFTPLPEDQLRLRRAALRAGQSSEFRVYRHVGWLQPMFAFGGSRRVRLDPVEGAPGAPVDGWFEGQTHLVDGTVALRLGRFVNLEVDLRLRVPAERALGYGSEAPAEWVYRLSERRQIRLGENHYFDHPAFVLIARVERIEVAETGAESPAAGD